MRAPAEVEALEEGDRLLLLGTPLAVADLVQRSRSRGRAVLIGGGDVGVQLATLFSTLVGDVRLIEPSRSRSRSGSKVPVGRSWKVRTKSAPSTMLTWSEPMAPVAVS